jgi:hypothetical protein
MGAPPPYTYPHPTVDGSLSSNAPPSYSYPRPPAGGPSGGHAPPPYSYPLPPSYPHPPHQHIHSGGGDNAGGREKPLIQLKLRQG